MQITRTEQDYLAGEVEHFRVRFGPETSPL